MVWYSKPVQASVTQAEALPLNFAPEEGLIISAGQKVVHSTLFFFPLPSSIEASGKRVLSVLVSAR